MTAIFNLTRHRRNRAVAADRPGAALATEVRSRLLESLLHLGDARPARALDLGSLGEVAATLAGRLPKTRVLAVGSSSSDPALAAVQRWWRRPAFDTAVSDFAHLPLADASLDLAISSLRLHRVPDLPAVLAELRRVLRPGALLLCALPGASSLAGLRAVCPDLGIEPASLRFVDIRTLGDALLAAGFRDPVLDRDPLRVRHRSEAEQLAEVRAIAGAGAIRTPTPDPDDRTGRVTPEQDRGRDADGTRVTRWDILYAQAWAPAPGTPRRSGGIEIAAVPADAIRVRRRR